MNLGPYEITSNDLKKGDRVRLRNGWYGTVADNKKGNTRMVTVEGDYTETGSVYSHDIMMKIVEGENFAIYKVVHTPAQIKLRDQLKAMGW